jgi:alkylhydroperoxidase family enzyme
VSQRNSPRVTPLPDDEWDEGTTKALSPLLPAERANPHDAGSLLATLLRHPSLTRAYLTFNAHLLLHSTLSPRVREIVILRAAVHRRSDYLWDHHVPLADRAGLTPAEINGVRTGFHGDGDGDVGVVDRLVVEVVDEMERDDGLGDDTWAALGEHFDERQRMDLVFTVGAYNLLAVAVNTFRIGDDR